MQTSARIRLQANAPCIARNARQIRRTPAPLARCCTVAKQEQALLWFEHISKPVDCLPTANAVLYNVQSMLDAVDVHQDAEAALADIELYKLSLSPGLQLLADRHPDSAWRQAAAAAHQLLEHGTDSLIADWKHARAAAAFAPGSSSSSSVVSSSSSSSVVSSSSSSSSSMLLHELQQLQDWLQELLSLEAEAKAAAVQAVQSNELSPVLLISQQQAQQHPAWAADFQAWQQQQQQQQTDAAAAAAAARNRGSQQEHSAGSSVAGGAVSHQSGDITGNTGDSTTGNTTSSSTSVGSSSGTSSRKLLLLLPAIHDLRISDEVTLPVGQYYAAAAAGNNNIQLLSPKQGETLTSQTTTEGLRSFMPWPLTAAATAVLLSSPPSVLSQGQLHAVQLLGLEARVQVLAAAVDLVYLLQQETDNTKVSLKAAFAQLGVTAVASYGKAVAPTQICSDSSSSNGGSSSFSSSTYGASRHPAVAAAFLAQVAGFCKQTAAEEVQSWLSICTQANLTNPLRSSSSSSSSDLQRQQQQQQQPAGWQLPDSLGSLHPYQVEGLRQAVAIIETEQIAQQSVSSSGMFQGQPVNSSKSSDVISWLADYTDDTLQLLQGACELLGSTLNLSMNCAVTPKGSSWCEEGYVITVADDSSGQRQQQWPVVESSSSSSSVQLLGEIWVLFDPHYTGLPYTATVRQGGFYKVVQPFNTLRHPDQASPHASEQQCGTWSSTALQPCKVAIIFPELFGSAGNSGVSEQIDGSNSSTASSSSSMSIAASSGSSHGGGSGTGGSSSSSTAASPSNKLSTLLHEFGHALHFVLSATAKAASTADCGCWAACDICETVAHLTERMTRDTRCLQVLLRHKMTRQPPPLHLTLQLQLHMVISNRGAYQWQQHVMAALVDAKLAAAAAGGGSSGSCWDVLQDVRQKYEPLSFKGLHPSMLTYLPMAAVAPGNAYSYVFAELVSAAVWAKYLNPDPLDPAAGSAVRRLLFEASATQSTAAVVERLLGKGSMHQLIVNLGQISSSSSSVSSARTAEQLVGYVPNLEHQVFQDIDLWA